jgi:predicted PurR-regulated permease PerM
MLILETSQIIFNLVISLAVIVITVLISVIAYDIIKFIRSIKKFMDGVNKESAELYNKINNFLETISNLSIISKLFKKKHGKKQ